MDLKKIYIDSKCRSIFKYTGIKSELKNFLTKHIMI